MDWLSITVHLKGEIFDTENASKVDSATTLLSIRDADTYIVSKAAVSASTITCLQSSQGKVCVNIAHFQWTVEPIRLIKDHPAVYNAWLGTCFHGEVQHDFGKGIKIEEAKRIPDASSCAKHIRHVLRAYLKLFDHLGEDKQNIHVKSDIFRFTKTKGEKIDRERLEKLSNEGNLHAERSRYKRHSVLMIIRQWKH